MLTASLASAQPSEADAKEVVQKELLTPLRAKEQHRSRFSRAALPPLARRLRVPDAKAVTDAKGAAFIAFSVDAQRGYGVDADADDDKAWRKDVITGCVYPETRAVYVLRGEKYFEPGMLLGKKSTPAPDAACKAGDGQLAAK